MTILPGPNKYDDNSTGSSKLLRYIFDLQIRKDLEKFPPLLVDYVLPQFQCEPISAAKFPNQHGKVGQQPGEQVKVLIFLAYAIPIICIGGGALAG